MIKTTSLLGYFALEARRAAGAPVGAALVAGLVLLGATQVLLPLLPESAISLLRQAFHLRGMASVVLLNDYLAVYAVLFFGGVAQLFGVVALPREARTLDLLLAKPVTGAQFVTARALPVLASTVAQGGILALACGAAAAFAASEPGDSTAAGAFAATLVLTAGVVVLLALVNLILVRVADTAQGLLIAFVAWTLPLLPASVMVYRPDLFEGHALTASLLVLPANLVWHEAAMLAAAPAALAAAMAIALALTAGAGVLLERGER
jgi:hypothetical protein